MLERAKMYEMVQEIPRLTLGGVSHPNTDYAKHHGDVIMGAIASQITSLTIVYSTVYSDADQRKHQSSASLVFCVDNLPGTGEYPAQRASYAGNVTIWWRHHATTFSAPLPTIPTPI